MANTTNGWVPMPVGTVRQDAPEETRPRLDRDTMLELGRRSATKPQPEKRLSARDALAYPPPDSDMITTVNMHNLPAPERVNRATVARNTGD